MSKKPHEVSDQSASITKETYKSQLREIDLAERWLGVTASLEGMDLEFKAIGKAVKNIPDMTDVYTHTEEYRQKLQHRSVEMMKCAMDELDWASRKSIKASINVLKEASYLW